MQALFEWDFRHQENLQEIVSRGIKIFESDIDAGYVISLVEGVKKNLKDIDESILRVAPEFPIEQIANIDKAVLRLAIYELLYDEKVPAKVVINEAVELAKVFGGENSFKFVNGVLGTLYRKSEKYNPADELPFDEQVKNDDEKMKSYQSDNDEDIKPIEEI